MAISVECQRHRQIRRNQLWLSLLVLVTTVCGFQACPQLAQAQEDNSHSSIDELVNRHMETINATAATLAISVDGKIVYSKGYGFSDRKGQIATRPRTTMRLASCTKPLTAAAIQQLIAREDLSAETKVFDYLGIPPIDRLADPRVKQITIGQLLDHRGGWNRDEAGDPMYDIENIKKDLRVPKVKKRHIVRYMWKQPLQFDPGEQECYSNFGYLLLGLVIERATQKSYLNGVRELIEIEADEISISSPVKGNRRSRESHYPIDNDLNFHVRDSASGIAANSETLCKFMARFWLDGTAHDNRRRYLYQFGTHPNTTTTLMEQRLDGIHYAIMLNSRREDHYNQDNDDLRTEMNSLLDSVGDQLSD